ncbi:MAG: transglutaminase TgpA family protein [Anaerolineae bacterium]
MRRDRLYASGVAVPILLSLAALSVALSLFEAAWGPGLAMLPWLVVASIAYGWVSVRSVIPPWVLHLVSLALGFFLAVFLAGRFVVGDLTLSEGAQLVVYRLGRWAQAAYDGLPTDDALPFSFLLGLCLWMAFYFSTWLIYRSGKVWWAIAGPAVALLVNSYYAGHANSGYVALYAFCSLLLVVRVSLQGLSEDWRLARIPHDRTLGEDFLIDAAYIVAVVLVVTWLLPPLTLEQRAAEMWVRFEKPWRSFQQQWEGLFPTTATSPNAPQVTIYGDSLVLGGPVNLADTPLFRVTMPEASHLQGMVYDLYDGRQWWSSASTISLVDPDEYPTAEAYTDREYIEQTITVLAQTRSLVSVPSPRWFDLPVKSEHVVYPVEDASQGLDIYATTARQTLAPGETYRTLSAVSRASKAALREAGDTYPAWMPSVYLALPSSLPTRVGELARAITEDAETPYDKAEALEAYLRELSYSAQIAAPPVGRDSVDYFLFDSREGYCNYFASSMVVLARSLGIPARVAAGYAGGEYDATTGSYTVLGSSAHAWPQLYFPGYGWVDFEPTPSQPVVGRADPTDDAAADESAEESDPSLGNQGMDEMLDPYLEMYGDMGAFTLTPAGSISTPLRLLLGVAALALLAVPVLVLWVLPRRRWTTAERLYSNLTLAALALGVRPQGPETPAEYGQRIGASLPTASADVAAIVAAFCRARYGAPGAVGTSEEGTLAEAWRRVWLATRRALPRRLGISPIAR